MGLAVDITERKRAGEDLQRSKDFAESVIQTANVIFLQLDAAGVVRKINAAAQEITGYERAEVEGTSWFEVPVPRDRYPHVWEEFERLMKEGATAGSFDNPILTKQGPEPRRRAGRGGHRDHRSQGNDDLILKLLVVGRRG